MASSLPTCGRRPWASASSSAPRSASPRSAFGSLLTEMTEILADDMVKTSGPTRAPDHVDLAVPSGELWGVVGADGAGKTTLFRCIAGLLRSTRDASCPGGWARRAWDSPSRLPPLPGPQAPQHAGSRHRQARRPEPRARHHRHRPVALTAVGVRRRPRCSTVVVLAVPFSGCRSAAVTARSHRLFRRRRAKSSRSGQWLLGGPGLLLSSGR
jgi:energy-coupling factor transporter ATP-binding protein EcfA2